MTYETKSMSFGITNGVNQRLISISSGGELTMPRFRRRSRSRRRITGNTVIHVPSSVNGTLNTLATSVIVLASPSIFAGGSASSNIEAQDKDRTVNVGHHVGSFTIDFSIRNTTSDGLFEFCIYKVERASTTPVVGTHPVPSSGEINGAGLQQEARLQNPGKVFHYSQRSFSIENTITHKIRMSPAKFKLSKMKAGDHWILQIFNRSSAQVTFDFQCRYKEYE